MSQFNCPLLEQSEAYTAKFAREFSPGLRVLVSHSGNQLHVANFIDFPISLSIAHSSWALGSRFLNKRLALKFFAQALCQGIQTKTKGGNTKDASFEGAIFEGIISENFPELMKDKYR